MTSYEKFKQLCDSRGISPSAALVNAGLSKALGTKWKQNENATPNGMTLAKICKYFNISADYFLEDDEDERFKAFKESREVTALLYGLQNMTEQQRSEVLHYARYIAPNAFGNYQ